MDVHTDLSYFPTRRSSDLHEGGELWARHHHHGGGTDEQHDVAQRDRHGGADRGFDLGGVGGEPRDQFAGTGDRKSTRLNSSHMSISYAVLCLKKEKKAEKL